LKKLLSILFLIIYSASFAQKSDFEKNLFWFELGSNRKQFEKNLYISSYDDFNSYEYRNKSYKRILNEKIDRTFLFFDENNSLQRLRFFLKDKYSYYETLQLLNKIEKHINKPLSESFTDDFKSYNDGFRIVEFFGEYDLDCECFEIVVSVYSANPGYKYSFKYESFEW
jgi:hypothetical protein